MSSEDTIKTPPRKSSLDVRDALVAALELDHGSSTMPSEEIGEVDGGEGGIRTPARFPVASG
jgi:hypothetical protein